uniref:hypothetical protein n=1 Tax=Polynucleobacter sp. TaxID=2029855 RepID=UPI00404866DA
MVHIILIIYEKGHYLNKYKEIFIKIFKEYSLIIINNGKYKIDNTIIGSNKFREFSGYYEGYNKIKDLAKDSDLIVFVNDSVLERRKFNGYFINAYKLFYNLCKYKIIKGLFIIGESHNIEEKIFEDSQKLNTHISTYFFITNKLTIEKIDINYMNLDVDISYNFEIKKFESKLISLEYINRLNRWLIKDKSQKKQWYKSDEITTENFDTMILKAKAVFKEHYLSHKCIINGVSIIPIYSKFKYSLSRIILFIYNKI